MSIYFDNAATTRIDSEVLKEMMPFFQEVYGNPSSTHAEGRKARAAIEKSRKKIAQLLKVSPQEIVFTSGGTEANNMAIQSAICHHRVERIITSPIEHSSVANTVVHLCEKYDIDVVYAPLDSQGHVDTQYIEEQLKSSKKKTLVSLMHGNNEIGNILPIQHVAALCNEYQAIFHSDAVQTIGHYPIDISSLGIHFVSCSAHKFHGPKGIGFLYVNNGSKGAAFMYGGGQERNYRSGTEHVAGIVGLAKALEQAHDYMDERKENVENIKQYAVQQLNKHIPGIAFNGDFDNGLYTVLNTSFPSTMGAGMLLFSLDLAGISVSGGSACSSGAATQSHVMRAIGHPSDRVAVRFSFSHENTKEEVDCLVRALIKIKEKQISKVSD